MKTNNMKALLGLWIILLATIACGSAEPAFAKNIIIKDMTIAQIWAKPSFRGLDNTSGYFSIVNNGKTEDRLLSVSTDQAKSTQIHYMILQNGVMKMPESANGIRIGVGQTIEFSPKAGHVMFMMLKYPALIGQTINTVFHFEKAGDVQVEFPILVSAPNN